MTFLAAYDPTRVGVYTATVTYTWGMPVQTVVKTFTATLTDSCVTAISVPTSSTGTYYLGGSDVTSATLQPTFAVGSTFCLVTTTITAAKTTNNPPLTISNVFTFTSLSNQNQATHQSTYLSILLSTYNLTYLGTYTFTVAVSWGNPVTTATFTRTNNVLDGCLTKVTPPASITNPYRSLLDFDDSTTWLSIGPTFVLPYTMCKYTITWTAVKTTNLPDTTSSAISFTAMT
jgi:hypothetical protein